jgi:hypothetical protein
MRPFDTADREPLACLFGRCKAVVPGARWLAFISPLLRANLSNVGHVAKQRVSNLKTTNLTLLFRDTRGAHAALMPIRLLFLTISLV